MSSLSAHFTAARLQSLGDVKVPRKAAAVQQIQRRQRRAVAEPLGQRGEAVAARQVQRRERRAVAEPLRERRETVARQHRHFPAFYDDIQKRLCCDCRQVCKFDSLDVREHLVSNICARERDAAERRREEGGCCAQYKGIALSVSVSEINIWICCIISTAILRAVAMHRLRYSHTRYFISGKYSKLAF